MQARMPGSQEVQQLGLCCVTHPPGILCYQLTRFIPAAADGALLIVGRSGPHSVECAAAELERRQMLEPRNECDTFD
jgi:hypothetical protein